MNDIKVLVADDEPFISSAYVDGFGRSGFKVISAKNGEEAFNLIKSNKPDIVLLDLIMPKLSGFEVLKKLKADPELKAIPVMILSNLSQDTDATEAKALGALDFIVKSNISLKELVSKVKKSLGVS